MTLEQQLVSLKPSQRLRSIGIKQESIFFWETVAGQWRIRFGKYNDSTSSYSAFTIAELGEMLPYNFETIRTMGGWQVRFKMIEKDNDGKEKIGWINELAVTEADARAQLLISLIEKGLWKA